MDNFQLLTSKAKIGLRHNSPLPGSRLSYNLCAQISALKFSMTIAYHNNIIWLAHHLKPKECSLDLQIGLPLSYSAS